MSRILCPLMLLVILSFGCGKGKPSSEKEKADSLFNPSQARAHIPDSVINIWKEYFTEAQIDSLASMNFQIDSLKTDVEFAEYYQRLTRMADSLEAHLDRNIPFDQEPNTKFSDFNNRMESSGKFLPGLIPTCFGECTILGFAYDFGRLGKVATSTSGNTDDIFTRLMVAGYGDTGRMNNLYALYYMQTWDYG